MRRLFTLPAAVGIASVLSGCAGSPTGPSAAVDAVPAPATQIDYATWGYRIVHIEVSGLSCPLCAHNLNKQFTRFPSVVRTDLDLGAGLAIVQLKPDGPMPTDEQFIAAVHDAGFTPGAVIHPKTQGGAQ